MPFKSIKEKLFLKFEKHRYIYFFSIISVTVFLLYFPTIGFHSSWGNDTKVLSNQESPLTFLSYECDRVLWQSNPKGYHVTQIFLYALGGILVFLIASILLENDIFGLLTAFIFILHPINVETVVLLNARPYILGGLFFLLAFYLHIVKRNKNLIFYIASLVCFFLSCLSLTSAVIFPLFILAYDLYFKREETWKRYLVRFLPYFGISALICILNSDKFDRFFPLSAPGVLLDSIKILFSPFNLVPLYEPDLFSGPIPWVLFVIFIALIFVVSFKRSYKAAFILIWYLLSIFPSLFYLPSLANSYFYLPSIAICFAFGLTCLIVSQYPRWLRGSYYFLLVILIIGLGVLSFSQIKVWYDDISLWGYAHSLYPEHMVYRMNLARAHFEQASAYTIQEGPKGYIQNHAIQAQKLYRSVLDVSKNMEYIKEIRLALPQIALMLYVAKTLPPANDLPNQGDRDNIFNEFKETIAFIEKNFAGDNRAMAKLYKDRADAYVKLGEPELGETDYRKALKFSPEDPNIRLGLAKSYIKFKSYNLAKDELKSILDLDPNFYSAKISLASLSLKMDDPKAAFSYLDELLVSNPENPDVLYETALLYESQGNKSKLRYFLERLTEKAPWDTRGWVKLANFLEGESDWEASEKCYLKALSLRKWDITLRRQVSQFYVKQGVQEYKKGFYTLAMELYQKGIKIDQENPDAYFELAMYYKAYYISCIASEKTPKIDIVSIIVSSLEKALALCPNSSRINLELGHAYLSKKIQSEKDQATSWETKSVRCFEEHIQTAGPKSISEFAVIYAGGYYKNKADYFCREGDLEKAKDNLNRAFALIDKGLELLSQNPEWQNEPLSKKVGVHTLRAQILKSLGHVSKAIHDKKSRGLLIQVQGRASSILPSISLYYENEPNELYEAYQQWGRYLATMPDDYKEVEDLRAETYERLGEFYKVFYTLALDSLKSGSSKNAVRFFSLAAKSFPERISADPLYQSARILYKENLGAKNMENILSIFKEVLKRDPSFYKVHFYIGEIYYWEKRLVAARDHFSTFMEKNEDRIKKGIEDSEADDLAVLVSPYLAKIKKEIEK